MCDSNIDHLHTLTPIMCVCGQYYNISQNALVMSVRLTLRGHSGWYIHPRSCYIQHTLLPINGHQKRFTPTLAQYEEPDGHVDKDPWEAQELHQVVHEQIAFLQTQVGWGKRAEVRWGFLMTIELHDESPNGLYSETTATQHYSTITYLRSFRILDSTLILFILFSSWKLRQGKT